MISPTLFARYRAILGGKLTQDQVDGIETITQAFEELAPKGTPPSYLAYMLATAAHETAYTFQPIHERGPRAYFDKYERGTKLGKVLGNTVKGDGYLYRGRGYVQITGRANYLRAQQKLGIDLIARPELALVPATAAKILIKGCFEGWFTGKGLANYIDAYDEDPDEDLREFMEARRVVNGKDKATVIAALAIQFRDAILAENPRKPTTASTPIGPPSASPIPSVPEVKSEAVPTQVGTQAPPVAPADAEAPPLSTPLQVFLQAVLSVILALVKGLRK